MEEVGSVSRNAPPKNVRSAESEAGEIAPQLVADGQPLTGVMPVSTGVPMAMQPATATMSIAQHQTLAGSVPVSLQTAIRNMQLRNASSAPLAAIRPAGSTSQLPRFTMNLPDFKGDMFTPSAAAVHAAAENPDVFDQLPWEQVVFAPIILPMEEATDLMSTEVDLSSRVARQRRPVGSAVLSGMIDPSLADLDDAHDVQLQP